MTTIPMGPPPMHRAWVKTQGSLAFCRWEPIEGAQRFGNYSEDWISGWCETRDILLVAIMLQMRTDVSNPSNKLCIAMTNRGRQCRRAARHDGFCDQHALERDAYTE